MYMDIFQLTYISLYLLTTFSDLNQQKKKKCSKSTAFRC